MRKYTWSKLVIAIVLGIILIPEAVVAKSSFSIRILKSRSDGTAPKEDLVVKGRIVDEKGLPVPGVNVLIKGTTTGVITDIDGRFSITVADPAAVLLISFVGFTTEEIAVNGRSEVSISLNPDIATLSDVVVIGYGSQQKRDVTGAVGSVSEEQIKAVPVMGADQAMQGRVAGVQITNSSGAPGGGVQVRIRGVGSLGSGAAVAPLYVVDGIPLAPWNEGINNIGVGFNGGTNQASPLSTINPNDIESIEVLKDASATSIYGARASNGVVLITTKSGKAGKMRIDFNAYYGVQTLARKIPLLNQKEYAINMFEHSFASGDEFPNPYNEGAFALINPYLLNSGNTDWVKEITRVAPMQNYNLSLSGGTDKVQYMVSADYFDQKGIIINSDARRFSARVNLDAQINEWFKVGVHNTISNQRNQSVDMDDWSQSIWKDAGGNNPLVPTRFANGQFYGNPYTILREDDVMQVNGMNYFGGNTLAKISRISNLTERFRVLSNTYAELKLAPGLSFRSNFGIDLLNNQLTQIRPPFRNGFDFDNASLTTVSQPRSINWVTEHVLTYNKTFAEIHNFNILAGVSAQQFDFRTLFASGSGSPDPTLIINVGNQRTIVGGGGRGVSSLASQFSRLNYTFKDRYLFTATVRRDGSSRFGPENRYGVFPSASIGWRASEESFMKNITFINDLKFRTSYGITGNQEIGDFRFLALANNGQAVMGNGFVNSLNGSLPNANLVWERNKQMDVGMDLSLLKGRANLTVDWYNRDVDNLLDSRSIAPSSGLGTSITDNIGSIRNRGWEFALNTINVDKAVRWSTDFNFSINRNTVTALGQPFIIGTDASTAPRAIFNKTVVGRGIGEFWVIEEGPQYQNWEEAADAPNVSHFGGRMNPNDRRRSYIQPGDNGYINHSGGTMNGVALINDSDRVFVGSPLARYFGGFNNTVSYKGLSLSLFLVYQGGNLIWNAPARDGSVDGSIMWRSSFQNRWTPENAGTVTTTPIARRNSFIGVPTRRFLEDGSFVRGRNITLSYDIPSSIVNKAKMAKARVYFQVNNAFTITKYTGWDPEISSTGSRGTTAGIDIGGYPNSRSFVLGVNLGLQ